tara:strand:- start:9308 stop:10306 length:999 start_codon:yes stop_codon:yes gene_type:complete
MKKNKVFFVIIFFFNINLSIADEHNFQNWLNKFNQLALEKGISKNTIDLVMQNAKFLPKVIEYDRYQPEFYEDTKTYIGKRASRLKIEKGKKLYKSNKNKILDIDKKFNVEKELLLALMGIETNYGTYLGKMDIISSLATLSFDKRRSEFFTNELITILKLIDNKIIDHNILFGSWAGAYGNFQFMPTTIENYAIDYNKNNKIELRSLDDSFASAANYLIKIGWKRNKPCFIPIELNDKIPDKFLNTSAKKIINKRKLVFFKKYIKNSDSLNINENSMSAIITPDKDIVENANRLKPAFLVFNNYELILKWNRSLRFALAVCTLKNNFSNEL